MRLKMTDEELQINPALELYLRERHHITLPQLPDEPNEETLGQFFDQIKRLVSEQGWQVEDRSWLSTFSFESLVIYKDLLAMVEMAHENPIIAAFARAGILREGSESLGEDLDEAEVPNQVPIPVMPADASQLRALSMASANNHLVVHGPPGTGKSQTITNLIADALGQGKKVLFVSAKMAALDVVYDRLRGLGLDRYCLEAHSTKAGKAKIIEELKRTLEMPINGQGANLEEQLTELKRVRSQLNEYVKEIHQKREPLGKTIYQIIGKVAKLQAFPTIEFTLPWADVLTVTREELGNKLEILDSLSVQASIFDNQSSHPWRGLLVVDSKSEKPEIIKKNLEVIVASFDNLSKCLMALSQLIIPKNPDFTLSDLRKLTDPLSIIAVCDGLPEKWTGLSEEQLQSGQNLFDTASSKSELFESYLEEHKKVTNLAPKELRSVLEPLNTEFSSWTRVFKSSFWKWKKDLRKHLLPNVSNSYASLRSYIKKALELEGLEGWFVERNNELSKVIAIPLGNSKKLKSISVQFSAAQKLKAAAREGIIQLPKNAALMSEEVNKVAHSIIEHLKSEGLNNSITLVDQNWPDGFVDSNKVDSVSVGRPIERSKEILQSMQKMHEWIVFRSVLTRCQKAELEPLLKAMVGVASAKDISRIFEKRFYQVWAETTLDSTPSLREFAGAIREEKIQQFKALDGRIQSSTLRRIQAMAAEPARSVTNAQTTAVQGASEIGILRRELQRRRRIKPLRKLFQEIPHVLQAIKPCMLMSPLSVSTFLKPGSISFDLVVFDEASQLPTQEAIPSILRAKQVVVAGDENQLPPTSFFMASSIFEEEEDSEDDYEPLESLLNDCVAVAPVFKESKIVWHYRSRDERLIKFSNHYFYNNSLVTFPSTTTSDEGRGVHLVYTPDGVWDRGKSRTNRIEAHKVAQIVVDQLQSYPDRSVGVVSMNASQKEAIENALDEIVSGKPELRDLWTKVKKSRSL